MLSICPQTPAGPHPRLQLQGLLLTHALSGPLSPWRSQGRHCGEGMIAGVEEGGDLGRAQHNGSGSLVSGPAASVCENSLGMCVWGRLSLTYRVSNYGGGN